VSRLKEWALAAVVLLVGRKPKRPVLERERLVGAGAPEPGAELAVLVLFGAATLCAVAFVVFYALDRLPAQTQLLGLALGLSFAFLAAACILIGKRLVVTEELEEPYPVPAHPEEREEVVQIIEESGSRFTRKRLVTLAGAAAGTALAVALVTPAVSLGPVIDMDSLYRTPWRRGRRLIDEGGNPLTASDIERDVFYTAFPEGADPELVGSPLVVVRLDPGELELPAGRADWAPEGILAYSKICTHAACAIALYRKPLFPPAHEPRPALICPCHYSTFDPARGGAVLYGPAGRPLPQLPLAIMGGELRAAGNFSGPVGPSWWGVRMGEAKP
jgi:ubiquinol-cytochrome c reductase iron-sulfur subunit